MANPTFRRLRTAAVAVVASGAAVAGLIGIAGAVGSSSPHVTGFGYGYSATGVYGYGNGYAGGYGYDNPSGAATTPSTGTSTPPPSSTSPSTSPTTPAPSASPTTSPTTNPATGLKISLHISKIFVTLGTRVTLSGTATRNGVVAAGVPVSLFERYSDGKLVSLGTFTTNAQGNFSHVDRPLYIGNITAKAFGVGSNTVPSRVIVTYREVRTSIQGDVLSLFAQTRPGFKTGAHRAERVQLLLTDSHGRQLKVLSVVQASQRKFFTNEAQGVNQATFPKINLGSGTHYVVVKVIGTPVNTGAPTRPIKIVTP